MVDYILYYIGINLIVEVKCYDKEFVISFHEYKLKVYAFFSLIDPTIAR